MGTVKVMARAMRIKDLEILKEKLQRDYGTIWSEGPFEDRDGSWKSFFTFEVKENDKR